MNTHFTIRQCYTHIPFHSAKILDYTYNNQMGRVNNESKATGFKPKAIATLMPTLG